MCRAGYLCILLCCLFFRFSRAEVAPFIVPVSESGTVATDYIEILEDKTDKKNIQDIRMADSWRNLSGYSPAEFPKPNTTYWIRLKIKNELEGKIFFLEIPYRQHSSLKAYEVTSSGKTIEYPEAGISIPFTQRDPDHRNYFIKSELNTGESSVFYIRLNSAYPAAFGVSIQNTETLLSYSIREYYLLGFFYGVLIILSLYHLFNYLTVKENLFLWFIPYMFGWMIFMLAEDGLAFQFLWPGQPLFNHLLFSVSPALVFISFIIFSFEFSETNKSDYTWLRYIFIAAAFYSCMLFLFPALNRTVKAFILLTPFVIMLYKYAPLYHKGKKEMRFWITGSLVILAGFLVHAFQDYGLLNTGIALTFIFHVFVMTHILFFSFALTEKINRLDASQHYNQQQTIEQLREQGKLKDKLNRELENKVRLRTTELINKSDELETANIRLRQLTQELNFINSQLDKDNWQLKRQVKNETRSRILSERVTYEEFLKIYPHEHACFQHLSDLKWDKGFQCKKCGNQTHSKGEKPFSRKCNRCKYAESVTAGTLFHGVKFPITKAFYIVYDSFNENNRTTIDRLSEIIDLRRVTVWSFRKKVQESKYIKQKQKKNLAGWESLILE